MAERISDNKSKRIKPVAHSVPFPVGTKAQLAVPDGLFNDYQETTKRKGSVVLCSDNGAGAGYAFVMSVGSLFDSKWAGVGPATDVTVSAASNTVGTGTDRKPSIKKRLLGGIEFPVIPVATVANGDSGINSLMYGGKKLGAGIIVEAADGTFNLFFAMGSEATSVWRSYDGDSAKDITPSAETAVTGSFDKKPKVIKSSVAAVPLTVTTETKLKLLSDAINGEDLNEASGKRVGSVVYAADTHTVYCAEGSTPASKWVCPVANNATKALTPV